jgi:hypothetical protein
MHVLPVASPTGPVSKPGSGCQVILVTAVHPPSRRLYTTQSKSHQDGESEKKDGNALFVKTALPHQLT